MKIIAMKIMIMIIVVITVKILIMTCLFLGVDIDECSAYDRPCGTNAVCQNAQPGYTCVCPQGFTPRPSPQVACEQVRNSITLVTRY